MEAKEIAELIAKEADKLEIPNPTSRLYNFYMKVASEVGKLMFKRSLEIRGKNEE